MSTSRQADPFRSENGVNEYFLWQGSFHGHLGRREGTRINTPEKATLFHKSAKEADETRKVGARGSNHVVSCAVSLIEHGTGYIRCNEKQCSSTYKSTIGSDMLGAGVKVVLRACWSVGTAQRCELLPELGKLQRRQGNLGLAQEARKESGGTRLGGFSLGTFPMRTLSRIGEEASP